MLKLFKRSSKPVSDSTGSDEKNPSSSVVSPINRRELLTRFVGRGKESEPLNEIFEKSNIGKYCRVTIQDNWLIVSELTDVELLRISGDQIKRCLQDKLHNCVAVIHDAFTYLFETCSVKEAEELTVWIRNLIEVKSKFLLTEETVTKHVEQKKNSGKSNASKGLLHPLSKVSKIGRAIRSRDVTVSSKTRQQKIEAVLLNLEILMKDNNRLRLVCSNAPMGKHCDPFWVALRSLTDRDCGQLAECLRRSDINVESCDPDGNTLLHYATVLGRKDMMRLLYKGGAYLDSAGWRMVTPLHRAAACGDASVVHALLTMGATPNEVDVNKCSPLHICASDSRYLECMHKLVEHGAKIRWRDCNGIRPIDLYEDLRVIQNELITSACERFADAPLKVSRSATVCSGNSSVITHTSSTASASHEPNITMETSRDPYHCEGNQMVNELLDQVVAHAANSMVSSELKQSQRSQSFTNLHQLPECKEESSNLLNLKYPSAHSLNVKGLVEESADNVERTLKDLISAASKVNAGQPRLIKRTMIDHDQIPAVDSHIKRTMIDHNQIPTIDLHIKRTVIDHDQISNSDYTDSMKVTTSAVSMDIPAVTSKTSLNAVSSSTLMNSDSSESRSTQNVQDIFSIQESPSTHMLHRAFSNLERQLYQERKEALAKKHSIKENVVLVKKDNPKDYIKEFRNGIGLPSAYGVSTRSKEETNYLFEEILHELEDNHNLFNKRSSESNCGSLQGQYESNLASHELSKSHDGPVSCDLSTEHVNATSHYLKSVMSHDLTGLHDLTGSHNLTGSHDLTGSHNQTKSRALPGSHDPTESHDHIETISVATCGHTTSFSSELDHCRRSSMGTVTIPYDMAEDEPGAAALKQLVTISNNEECLGRIVAHVCLPAFSSKLLQLSQWQCSSEGLLSNMAALLYNLFEVGTSEDRKKALDSGLLSIVVKLLQSRHPLPGTCMALLGGLLISEDNEDYLPTIIKIPILPLLKFLEPLESDSGFRGTSTCSSSERRHSSFTDPKLVRSSYKLSSDTQHEAIDIMSCTASEVVSENSSHSAVGPSLTGQLMTNLEARSIALRLLALSSTHVKVIGELCNDSALALLVDILTEPSQKDVVNALTTLANVATHSASHFLLGKLRISDKIKTLAQSGPSARYQVTRLLVYTGELRDNHCDGNLFANYDCGYVGQNIIMENDDPPYVKGASIEQLVQILTNNYLLLWGGVELGSKEKWMVAMGIPSEEQLLEEIIIDFFLTTYRSFVEPIILLRLLLHRIKVSICEDVNNSIRIVESSGVMILAKWIRTFPDDFRLHPVMKDEVDVFVAQLRKCGGPRLQHAHQIKNLLYNLKHHRCHDHGHQTVEGFTTRVPHHDHLYPLCQRMILSNHLPSTEEQVVILAALQLHIEIIAMQASSHVNAGSKPKQPKPLSNSRIKLALPVHRHTKIRQLSKRVNVELRKLSELSERNAKHAYIEYCMTMPGYGATFYEIRVLNNEDMKHLVYVTQLMGINEVEIILLDSHSRNVLHRYSIEEILGIYHEPGKCLITLVFKETKMQFVTLTPSIAMEICNTLEQYQDNNDWIKLCNENFELDDNSSWNKCPKLSSNNFESTSSPSSSDVYPLEQITAAGISSYELSYHRVDAKLSFCNCPPDPQMPKHLHYTHMNFKQLLTYPVELARQICLIDHELLRSITTREILQKGAMDRYYLAVPEKSETGIERLAAQFNKLGSFVTQCVMEEQALDARVNIMKSLILVAQNCFELKNFNAVMAIAILGLQSVPVRNLKSSWEEVPALHMDFLQKMLTAMDFRANYSNYRDILKNTVPPAIPYLGVLLKDLNSINESNSDYTKNGLVNLHKRRQIYIKMMEMKMMQSTKYNILPLECVQNVLVHQLNTNSTYSFV